MPTTKEDQDRRRFLLLLLGGCFAAPFLLSRFRHRTAGWGPLTPEAQRGAPQDLSFPRVGGEGGRWSLADERGHVVLLNLWATWCGFCRVEMPLLVQVNEDASVRVAGVSLDTTPDRLQKIAAFAKEYAVTYPLLLPEAGSMLFADVRALPTTLLFDRKGRLARVVTGALEEAPLRADLQRLQSETA